MTHSLSPAAVAPMPLSSAPPRRAVALGAAEVRCLHALGQVLLIRPVRWPGAPAWHDWDYEPNIVVEGGDGAWWPWTAHRDSGGRAVDTPVRCPLGVVGEDRWVQETWAPVGLLPGGGVRFQARVMLRSEVDDDVADEVDGDVPVDVDGDPDSTAGWRAPRTMPRSASRAVVCVEAVRAVRMQVLTDREARAAGVVRFGTHWTREMPDGFSAGGTTPRAALAAALRASVGLDWNANPWCWAVRVRLRR